MNSSSGYAELDGVAWTRIQGDLVRVKGSDLQLDFLTSALEVDAFLDFFVRRKVGRKPGREFPLLDAKQLTARSFTEPPAEVEFHIWNTWRAVPPATACKGSFWAELTLRHLEARVIGHAFWLAENGGSSRVREGEARIERAIAEENAEERNKQMDDCVRSIIRRLSGIKERGTRSVFTQCPFSRAWWRERLVEQTAARSQDETPDDIRRVLRQSNQHWENLVQMIVSRGSVYGTSVIQAAVIHGLSARQRLNPERRGMTAGRLRDALRLLSNLGAGRELSVLPFEQIRQIVEGFLTTLEQDPSPAGRAPTP